MSNTIIEILIDNSGSMGYMHGSKDENKYLIDGQTRMSLVKKLLIDEIIPTINYASKICLRTFRIEVEEVDKKIKHKEVQVPIIYDGEFNKEMIEASILKLDTPPVGGTPISEALEKSYENLKKYPQYDRKIILLTDGEENGGGDYISTSKKIESLDGIKCKIFIIGLALTEKSEKAAKEIANGGYFNIKTKTFKSDSLKQVIAPIKTAVLNDTIENIEQFKKTNQSITDTESKENTVKDKIREVANEVKKATNTNLDNLEDKIKKYISTGEELLEEFTEIKESIKSLDNTIIDATTLTIDEDYSEDIRLRSESYLYKILCGQHGVERVNWLNKEGEKYKPYDFELLDEQNNILQFIECKGTIGNKPTFYLTAKEWAFFIKNSNFYQVHRVFNLENDPNYFCIENLLDSLMTEKVVPYLTKPEILKENRVFLTLLKQD